MWCGLVYTLTDVVEMVDMRFGFGDLMSFVAMVRVIDLDL